MFKVVTPQMTEFIKVGSNEEAVDQPIYHIQSYATAGATSFTFFNTASGSATNALSDTNMDASNVLSAGKRFAVLAVSLAFFGSNPHINNSSATFVSPLNDAKGVLEGIGNFNFQVLDKTYLQVAPLSYLPAGFGLYIGGSAQQRTQASGADGTNYVAYANNGFPAPTALRRLRVPIPIPQQVKFQATLTFPSLITVGTASRIGCFLDGLLIRARQ